VTRDQLAKWDASARAWILTADEAYRFSQKQLLLIIDNVGIPVNGEPGFYENVIHTWGTAMCMIEKLVAGSPQSVDIGAPLLGLASWHLYPDMLVLGIGDKEIKQKDPLIHPGGLLTLGLQNRKRTHLIIRPH